jgi:hypothetical protein
LEGQPDDIQLAYRALAIATTTRAAARRGIPAESVQPLLDLLTTKEDQ